MKIPAGAGKRNLYATLELERVVAKRKKLC